MNRQIRKLGVALLAMFTVLFVQLNYIQVFKAPSLDRHPGNSRKVVEGFSQPRGTIVSADGTVLAKSVPSKDQFKFQRVYPEGELFGHVTGYLNFNFGSTGLESTYGDDLAGRTPGLDLQKLSDLFVSKTRVGNVNISIRKDVQEVARQALAGRAGSVVAVDPKTGAILAFYSSASYDPNPLASHGVDAGRARTLLSAAPSKPLLPKMYAETFFPGSTFKVVTGSIGLQSGKVTLTTPSYPVLTGYKIDFTKKLLSNFGGESCGGTLPEILKVSCNSSFAAMGNETIGTAGMVAGAEAFGFNSRPPIDLPAAAPSVFPTAFPKDQGNGPIARASIGQGDTKATPLEMALVAAAIANGGDMMTPHLMTTITDDQGRVVKRYTPTVWKRPISPQNAELMRQAMIGVVQGGTATRLAIPGYEVGGKTGTAQFGIDPPTSHAWIIGYAGPPGDPKVAVAVIVEAQAGPASEATGGRIAAPIGQAVMAKILADG